MDMGTHRQEIAMSQKQIVGQRSFDSLREVEEWLGDLTKVHTPPHDTGKSYYLHLDCITVIPEMMEGPSTLDVGDKVYHILAVYHRIYLIKGE